MSLLSVPINLPSLFFSLPLCFTTSFPQCPFSSDLSSLGLSASLSILSFFPIFITVSLSVLQSLPLSSPQWSLFLSLSLFSLSVSQHLLTFSISSLCPSIFFLHILQAGSLSSLLSILFSWHVLDLSLSHFQFLSILFPIASLIVPTSVLQCPSIF